MDNYPKIWGTNEERHSNDVSSVNILRVKKGGTCSLHTHDSKFNTFYVISGLLRLILPYVTKINIAPGKSFTVFPRSEHKFQALEDTVAVEIMFVKYDPHDIDRKELGYIDVSIVKGSVSHV